MRKRRMGVLCLAAALVIAAACGDDAENAAEEVKEEGKQAATTVVSALESGTRMNAALTGAAEVPGPGDPDGTGTAMVNVDVTKRQVCYEVTVQKIDRPTAMHIHEGERGKSGDVVVPLTMPTGSDTTTKGCADVDAGLMGRLTATPRNFYVNVHTDTYPQGAVRGQLG